MDRPGVCQVPEGSVEQRKMEETGYGVIYGAPTTLAVKVKMKVKEEESFVNSLSRLTRDSRQRRQQ